MLEITRWSPYRVSEQGWENLIEFGCWCQMGRSTGTFKLASPAPGVHRKERIASKGAATWKKMDDDVDGQTGWSPGWRQLWVKHPLWSRRVAALSGTVTVSLWQGAECALAVPFNLYSTRFNDARCGVTFWFSIFVARSSLRHLCMWFSTLQILIDWSVKPLNWHLGWMCEQPCGNIDTYAKHSCAWFFNSEFSYPSSHRCNMGSREFLLCLWCCYYSEDVTHTQWLKPPFNSVSCHCHFYLAQNFSLSFRRWDRLTFFQLPASASQHLHWVCGSTGGRKLVQDESNGREDYSQQEMRPQIILGLIVQTYSR